MPALDAEIDVDIRHAHSLRIQEPLEDQAVPDRVDICYLQAVCHDAAGCRPSSRADHDAVFLCEVDEVPHDQEVLHIPHGLDHAELIVKTLLKLRRHVLIPFFYTVSTELSQIVAVRIACRRNELRQMVLPERKLDLAFHRDPVRVLDSLRRVME